MSGHLTELLDKLGRGVGIHQVPLGGHVNRDFGISVRHVDRLLGGLLLATSPRIDWAKLLHRTYAVDVLRCGTCGDRLRVLAAITDLASAGGPFPSSASYRNPRGLTSAAA